MPKADIQVSAREDNQHCRIRVDGEGRLEWEGGFYKPADRHRYLTHLIEALLPFASSEGKVVTVTPPLPQERIILEAAIRLTPNEGVDHGRLVLESDGVRFRMLPEEQKVFRPFLAAAARDLVVFLVGALNECQHLANYEVKRSMKRGPGPDLATGK